MISEWVLGIAGILVTGGVPTWVTLSNRRLRSRIEDAQNDVDKVRVDGEAYDRAQKINAQIVTALREEITRLNSEMGELRIELNAEKSQSAELQIKLAAMQRTLNRMSAILRDNNLEVPA